MPIQPTPSSPKGEEEEQSDIIIRLDEMTAQLDADYPIPSFEGQPRWPSMGWMIVDLVAVSALGHPVIRTFQARDLINEDVSVTLPGLRARLFFTEVRKLLIFATNIGVYESIWDDEVLNARAFRVQDAKVLALMDDATIWNGKQVLELRKTVELFENATNMNRERLTFYVEWYDASLSQEISLVREQFRQRVRSTASRKRLRRRTGSIAKPTSAASGSPQ